jgi:high affinity sulfate transporter 1
MSGGRGTVPTGLDRWTPGLAALRREPTSSLRHDLLAGVVLAAFLVPVGMGYAQAAGLSPITGLYATIVPLVAYAILGPSRVLVLGPDSSLAPLIAAVVAVVGAGGGSDDAIEVAGVLAIATGALILLTGVLKLGFVTELLSRPARFGYLAGIALTIAVTQLPAVLGLEPEEGGLPTRIAQIARAVWRGEVDGASFAIGALAIAGILLLAGLAPRFPAVLLAVIGGIAAVAWFDLDIAVVGALPQGLPTPGVPTVAMTQIPDIAFAAIAIALVATADTSVLSQSLAMRRNEEVDPDRELVALGVANVAAGLFQGFPISSSSSRTPVAIAAGARSQFTPLVGALAVAALIVAAPGLLADLPQAVLGAIVITAAVRLVDVGEVRRLWRIRRPEFVLWLGAFAGVALLGVLEGVVVAIVLSLADFVRRAWRPHDAVLGRVDELKGYHDLERFPHARLIPGLLLYRFDAPLFFANATHFRREIRERIARADRPVRWVVVAAEPITDVDSTAASILAGLLDELDHAGITLAFAELKDPVKDELRRYGLFDRIGEDRFFPTLGTAVNAYVNAEEVDWVDWEDRRGS